MSNHLSMYKQPQEIVGGILENAAHHILLTLQPKWDAYKYLCFVGGHVEPGEDREAALKREVMEEVKLHLDLTKCEYLGKRNPRIPNNRNLFVPNREFHNYLCPVDYPDCPIEKGLEIQEAIWVRPEDAVEYLITDHAELIEELLYAGKLGRPSQKLFALNR